MLLFCCGWGMKDQNLIVGILVWVKDEGSELQCWYLDSDSGNYLRLP